MARSLPMPRHAAPNTRARVLREAVRADARNQNEAAAPQPAAQQASAPTRQRALEVPQPLQNEQTQALDEATQAREAEIAAQVEQMLEDGYDPVLDQQLVDARGNERAPMSSHVPFRYRGRYNVGQVIAEDQQRILDLQQKRETTKSEKKADRLTAKIEAAAERITRERMRLDADLQMAAVNDPNAVRENPFRADRAEISDRGFENSFGKDQSTVERRLEAPAGQRALYDRRQQKAKEYVQLQAKMGHPGANMKLQSDRAAETYLDSLKNSGLMDPETNPAKQAKQMPELHKAYTAMMVMQGLTPLQRGINAENVTRSVVSTGVMWMMSDNFKHLTKGYLSDAKAALEDSRGEKARQKLQGLQDKEGDTSQLIGRKAKRAAKLQKQVDKHQFVERGHREPFTEESAALTEIGLTEKVYEDLRAPDADPEEIMKKYDQARNTLYDYAEVDGLSREGVARQMRKMVGQRMESDPEAAVKFEGLGHGTMVKGEPKEVVVAGTGQTVKAWMGDFRDVTNDGVIDKGSFRVREPSDAKKHAGFVSARVHGAFADAKTVDELNEAMQSYLVGAGVRTDPSTVDLVPDEQRRDHLNQARKCFKSMDDDGLGQEEMHTAYTSGVTSAFARVLEQNPELAGAWAAAHGRDFQHEVISKCREYADLGVEAADRTQRGEIAEQMQIEDLDVEPAGFDDYDLEIDEEAAADQIELDQEAYQVDPQGAHMKHVAASLNQVYQVGLNDDSATMMEVHDIAEGVRLGAGLAEDPGLIKESDPAMVSADTKLIHGTGQTWALGQLASDYPDFDNEMQLNYGENWVEAHHEKTQDIAAFVEPIIPESAGAQTRKQILLNTMSQSISGDLAAAAQADPRGGVLNVAMAEYVSGDQVSDLADHQYAIREARREQMFDAMERAGLSREDRESTYKAAMAKSITQTAEWSPMVEQSAQQVLNWGNVRDADAVKTVLSMNSVSYEPTYRSYDAAEPQWASEKAPEGQNGNAEADVAGRRRRTAYRDSKFHTEREVQAGRWYDAAQEREAEQSQPQLG